MWTTRPSSGKSSTNRAHCYRSARTYLLLSPIISLYLPLSPYISLHLPASPCISLYLPTSPCCRSILPVPSLTPSLTPSLNPKPDPTPKPKPKPEPSPSQELPSKLRKVEIESVKRAREVAALTAECRRLNEILAPLQATLALNPIPKVLVLALSRCWGHCRRA